MFVWGRVRARVCVCVFFVFFFVLWGVYFLINFLVQRIFKEYHQSVKQLGSREEVF